MQSLSDSRLAGSPALEEIAMHFDEPDPESAEELDRRVWEHIAYLIELGDDPPGDRGDDAGDAPVAGLIARPVAPAVPADPFAGVPARGVLSLTMAQAPPERPVPARQLGLFDPGKGARRARA